MVALSTAWCPEVKYGSVGHPSVYYGVRGPVMDPSLNFPFAKCNIVANGPVF